MTRKVRLDDGAWLAYPTKGERAGEGGDAFGVRYFGNTDAAELAALHFANDNDGYRAVYMAPNESISEAEEQRE
ncbi:hypothetical protein [Nocardia sp. NPDC049707]|uniref:hypothetical protein n=1 Tax=Nocardia sp. NPDC049707 TaxID=3154735 RepID=UPI003420AF46